ncbi:MAG: glucodextranase DOMON-like domain-containing protein, partial [Exilispira sp.]
MKDYRKLLNKIFNFVLIFIAFIIVFSIPAWFIFSAGLIEPFFDKILKVRVDPSTSGGIIICRFYDDPYDDYGDGTYQYPLHEYFTESNICDIISYEVYRPLIDSSVSDPIAFWQVAVTFSKFINPFQNEGEYSNIQIAIYIDIDKTENGSNSTFYENAEYVEFPEDYAPDIMILANGLKKDTAKLFYRSDIVKKYNLDSINKNTDNFKSYEKEYAKDIKAIFVKEQNKIYFQIPLDNKFIQKVLDGRQTYHWVFSGFYDPFGSGGWMNVKENQSIRAAGGLKWGSGPKIFDLITPSGFDQKFLLSESNASINGLVVIPPLISNHFNPSISYLKEGKIIDKKRNNFKDTDPEKLSDSKNQSNIDKQKKIEELIKKIEE